MVSVLQFLVELFCSLQLCSEQGSLGMDSSVFLAPPQQLGVGTRQPLHYVSKAGSLRCLLVPAEENKINGSHKDDRM